MKNQLQKIKNQAAPSFCGAALCISLFVLFLLDYEFFNF